MQKEKITAFFKNRDRNYVMATQVINALVALVSGKLIALYILPGDFGAYNLQFAAYTFFLTLLISPAIQYIKTSNMTLLPKIGSKPFIWTLAGVGFLAYVLLLAFLYFYQGGLDLALAIIFILFIPLSILSSVVSDFLNIQNRIRDFSIFSILKGAAGLVFIVCYFTIGRIYTDNVKVLWIMQLAGFVLGLSFYLKKYKYFQARFNSAYRTFLKKYLRFSWPLMALALWSWINNYFDRYAIEYFLTLEDVGIYNASYAVGSKIFLMLSPVFMVLVTPVVFSQGKSYQKKTILKKYSLYYLTLSIPILLLIFQFRSQIGSILLSERYESGFYLIFWIAVAFFILTLAQVFELYFYAELKTKFILFGNIASAIVNIILNIWLIPIFGLFGASLATLIAFTIYLSIIYRNFNLS